ncbi:MAG: VWA domain-containing protein [Patulibacter sp.]|nr:VWA domain-containing protein [Patulibacter sp.]
MPVPAYPLSAIVGQDDLVEALLVSAVHPVVGGVLVRGERGTAKSTAVRALAPMLGTGDGDAAPLVELPLGATLDRLVGTLDLRAALEGEHRVEAGLLSRAHGGVLYVDEVNLLADHLVDALLDAAASGAVTVERDGVSVVQEARFILVGTMNPEEGELRPQLLDRFGLGVEVTGPREPAQRAAIVKRRMEFDADPAAFCARWADEEAAYVERIRTAQALIGSVSIGERELLRISTVCAKLDLDGVRGDLVCAHTARALAALAGATEVTSEHVERAAHLALRHRMRRDPLAPPPGGGRDPGIDDALEQAESELPPETPESPVPGATPDPRDEAGDSSSEERNDGDESGGPDRGDEAPNPSDLQGETGTDEEFASTMPQPQLQTETSWQPSSELAPPPRDLGRNDDPGPERPPRSVGAAAIPSRVPETALRLHRGPRSASNRSAMESFTPSGRAPGGTLAVVDSRPALADDPVAILPTILASLRGDARPQAAVVGGGRSALLCLIVDTSGSMAARRRLSRVKGALEAALRRAYARRDLVAVVAFSGEGARTLVAPGTPIEQAAAAVDALPAGGRTPLAAGIAHAADLLEEAARGHHAGRARIAVLLTDGRADDRAGHARAALARVAAASDRTVVVDLEDGRARLGLAAPLAAAAGADLTRLVAPGEDISRHPAA